MSEHKIKRHNKTLLLYHMVFPIKYRRRVLTKDVEEELKKVCIEIGKRHEINFVEIGTDEDHVHFLIQGEPRMSVTRIVTIVKSLTAREVFKRYPEIKKELWGGNFWTSGYYANTVGQYGNEQIISNYVKNQGDKYKKIHRGQLVLF